MRNFIKKLFFKVLSIFFKPDDEIYPLIDKTQRIFMYMKLKNSTVVTKGGIKYSQKNKVNLNAWINETDTIHNLGDWLSLIIVESLLNKRDLNLNKTVSKTKHLYAVGSVLLGWRDATVWGSGMLYDRSPNKVIRFFDYFHCFWHKTDVRAVRGPETRRLLKSFGMKCPEIYGDPGLLMPIIYSPQVEKINKYLVVPHYSDYEKLKDKYPCVSMMTDNWKKTIDEICSAELIISSSLHGIILAEAYGIPAILMESITPVEGLKYNDYYHSTKRYTYPIAKSVEEALNITPLIPKPELIQKMQKDLIKSFPYDLWE